MSILLQDLRYGVRLLTRAPVFTSVVLLTVALGVGANTTVFAVVNAALLNNLPYPDADRIIVADDLSGGEIVDWRNEAKNVSALAAMRDGTFDLTSASDRPERLIGATTDWRFFDVMGVAPALGRPFTQDDERTGQRVVVLSNGLWRSRFAADPNTVGRSIALGGETYTIVGVMPPTFGFPRDLQLWVGSVHAVPDHPQRPGVDMSRNYNSHYLTSYVRLAPGVGRLAAEAEQRAIFKRMAAQYPSDMSAADADIDLVPLRDWLVGDIRAAALVLLGVVGLVLLIGCANVANLLLARATARAQEMSVRTALGAGRIRIARQLLTESALLALVGGGLGVLTAAWALPTIIAISPADLARLHPALSAPVLLFALGVSLLTGIIFGCAPALQASGKTMAAALRSVGRATDGGQSARLRQALIVAECAASVMLLVLAGLLIRSFDSLLGVNPGFDAAGRQVARIVLPTARYLTPASQAQFFDQLTEQLRAVPGISGAAVAARLPFVAGDSSRGIDLDHRLPNVDASGGIRVVSPGYFDVLGQHLLQGRGFTEHDTSDAPPVAVLNETMARTYWPGQNALGHH
ncbi:MAG TPA: ABC transporter permease, partial [Vicinamibacterales bacterium]